LKLWSSFRLPPAQRQARLYRALVERGFASSVGGALLPTVDPFLYSISVTVTEGTSIAAAESALLEGYERVHRDGIPCSELDNGVVVIAKETRMTPAVTINLAVRAGSICDPADAPGATYLLSRVVDRGSTTRSADDIAGELDSRGLALSTTVTRHVFSMVCT